MIQAEALRFAIGDAEILAGVGLTTLPGRVLGLIGPNGSGKSTLLRCLHGVLRASEGAVLVDGEAIAALGRRQIARSIAVVAQDPPGEQAMLTVGEYVLLGRHPHRADHQSFRSDDHHIAAEALEQVGLAAHAHRTLEGLSGGERQRVLIARCIAQRAPHLLLDEPTNHLDIRFQHEVLDLVRRLGLTTVVVLHDLNLADRYCDHVVLLHDGAVVASGPPTDVLRAEVLAPVYGIAVRRVPDGDRSHLVFG